MKNHGNRQKIFTHISPGAWTLSVCVVLSLGCLVSQAYIPSYSTMVFHLSSGRGSGSYVGEQEVKFFSQGLTLTLKEKWWIRSPSEMRVDISSDRSPGLYMRFIYHRGKKIFKSAQNPARTQNIPLYHLENPFYLRDKEQLASLFEKWKVAPPLVEEKPDSKKKRDKNSFVRLVRKFGVVQYEMGRGLNRLWMEQDEFVIRGFQKDSLTVKAEGYSRRPGGLLFPSLRVVYLPGWQVQLFIKNLKSVKLSSRLFQKHQLKKSNHLPSDLPLRDKVYEFYTRFR